MKRSNIIIAVAVLVVVLGSFIPVSIFAKDETTHSKSSDFVEFDVPPTPTHTVLPDYPEKAKKAGISGSVVVKVQISEKGVVSSAEVHEGMKGHPEMGQAAVDALLKWRFSPARYEGAPVAVTVKIPVEFTLDDKKKQ